MMPHLNDDQIDDLVDGLLARDARSQAETHLAECTQCAAAAERVRGLIAASGRLRAIAPPPRLWPMVAGRTILAAAIRRTVLRELRFAFAMAATLLIAITSLIVNRIDARFMAAAAAAAQRRADSATVAPSSRVRPASEPDDSAVDVAKEMSFRDALSPQGKLVLAAAESLAVLELAIADARHDDPAVRGARRSALLAARRTYMRDVLRALGEQADDRRDGEQRRP